MHVVEHEIILFYDLKVVSCFFSLKINHFILNSVCLISVVSRRLFKFGELVCPAVVCIVIKSAM